MYFIYIIHLFKRLHCDFYFKAIMYEGQDKTQKCAEFFSHTKLCAGKKKNILFIFR